VVCTLAASELDRRLHQRPPESLTAPVGDHVELRQVALERLRPDRWAEAKNRQSLRLASSEEHRDLAGGEELPDALGQGARAGRGLAELAVEVVEELSDRLGVGVLSAADGEVGAAPPRVMVVFAASGTNLIHLERDGDGFVAEKRLEGTGVQCVAVAPADAASVYAGCRGGGLWVSHDDGRRFERSRLPEEDVFSVAVSAADGAVYAGCEPSRLYVSRDRGESWKELGALLEIPSAPDWRFPPRPWTSHVRWIAPCPDDPELLLVGIELGGVMRTDDAGESFSDHRSGAVRDVHSLAWHPSEPGRAYEAGGGGAAWSVDWGQTWQAADEGRDRDYVWALAVDPEDPGRWFVSASPGPFQAHGAGSAEAFIYRFEGSAWRSLGGGLPQPLDSLPYALRIEDGLLYAGLGDGRLYESADGGDSWRGVPVAGASPERIVALA
jgi:photosystem II stability/assembly factor-like uncharacterized protein